jgi:hypothetical protein
VVALDLGSAAPSVAGLAALPAPAGGPPLPQLVFDVKYAGTFTVTIECRVDVRDAPAWSTLDKAISRIGGGGGGEGEATLAVEGTDEEADREEAEGEEGGGAQGGESAGGSGGPSSPAGSRSPAGGNGGGGEEGRHLMGQLRRGAARQLRQLAEHTAHHISR